MKVLICGGRDFNDRKFLHNYLDNFCLQEGLITEEKGNWLPEGITIITGAARGADRIASDWAIINYVPLQEYPADWEKYGKSAGHIRNQQMLDEGRPDLVVAFPGGRGTANMIERAKKAGVETIIVE